MLIVQNHGEGLPDAYDSKRKHGRWKYLGKLGEGGLGVVHRARDDWGRLQGDIAIKVCKLAKDVKVTAKLRSAFILHREAQWSLRCIHNTNHKEYSKQKASLFAKYLEDHTGRWSRDCDFDEERSTYESAEYRWDKFRPTAEPIPPFPYVAMEYVPGKTLHSALGWTREQADGSHLNQEEKESIIHQATEALIYLAEMGLIHRDFRTTNLMVMNRKSPKTSIQMRVIDLGHTILAQEHQCRNKSAVVRCNWKEEEKKRFDWAPPEVKAREPFMNFSFPLHSFDIFSFGVLVVPCQDTWSTAIRICVAFHFAELFYRDLSDMNDKEVVSECGMKIPICNTLGTTLFPKRILLFFSPHLWKLDEYGVSCGSCPQAALEVQLQTNGMQSAREIVSKLMGMEAGYGETFVAKLGFSSQLLSKMLGQPAGRNLAA